jgi:hypothetical protein
VETSHLSQNSFSPVAQYNDRGLRVSLGTSRLEFFIDKGIVFVEENNGVEGLTLGGSGDILLSYRMGQEVFNVLLTHISRMGFLSWYRISRMIQSQ